MKVGILVVLAVLWVGPVNAAEPVPQLEVHGFAMGTLDSSNPGVNEHVRLILLGQLEKDLSARIVVTPAGPLSPLTYAELTWNKPTKGIDSVTIGRTFPPFGQSWYDWRADMVPTIYYSGIYWPNAAEDNGVVVTGTTGRLHWYAGGFTGQPLFGNDLGPAGYIKGEYGVTRNVTLGWSQRISRVPASGADLSWKVGRAELCGEMVSSQGLTQELLRAEYRVNKRVNLALQREWLRPGGTWTLAATGELGKNLEVKAGLMFGEHQKGRLVGQLVTRW